MAKILLGLALLFSIGTFAQNVRLEGTIKDSTGVALEMANIMAVNKTTNAMDSYAITDDAGRYQLQLKANTAYIIRASYIGYTAYEEELTTGAVNSTKNVVLKAGVELKELEIVHEMPVTIKGDTIVYNSDSFTNGTERKLEDVLKKLPGVEVDTDGNVKVEGKTVTKLMVEGKDFFDGDTKLGVKNIPADALDKIEVLRNYNEVGQLKGLENNEENVAMNIKLKEGKKNFMFGDVSAGASIGEGERYIVNPKLFYYSPKYSINLIGNFNNTGELPLTMQDYFKMTGGFRNMMKKGGTNFNVGSNDLGLTLLRNNRAKEIETKFGAANFSYNPTQAWSLSGFAIINSSRNELETHSRNTVLNAQTGEPETIQDTDEKSLQRSDFSLIKLSSSYKPNKNFQFDYDAFFKTSKQSEDNSLFSSVMPETSQSQDIYTLKKQNPFSINQNLNLYYTMDDKNVFAFEAQHLYQEEDPFYNANLANNPFPDAVTGDTSLNLGLADASRYDLNQTRFVTTNKFDAKFDYYYMLTPKANINLTAGNTYSYQGFNSSIFQILDDGAQDNLDANTKNDVNYSFNDVFLGLHYKFIAGKFTVNPGVSLHSYDSYNEQLGTKVDNSFLRVLPDVYAVYQIKKSERLQYTYNMTTEFTDVAKFAQGLLLNNYNSLFRGNRNLENALYQTHNLSYSKYNMFNFTQVFANVNYSHRMEAIKNLSAFSGINQVSTVENSNFADQVISGAAGYTRSFARYYKAAVNASVSWSRFNNFRFDQNAETDTFVTIADAIRQVSEQVTQNYTTSFSTNYKTLPNLEVGYTLSINDYANNKFYTHSPYVRMDYLFWKAFTLTADYTYSHYYNDVKTSDNEYDFLNANLMYREPGSKWEFKVGGTNLLNTTSLNDDSFNQFTTRTSRYRVQPRYLLLTVKYNI
ncbi:carboxypeptidase regulatory-like domain-containing protein [Flavobacterium zepuense]|uniref:Carboxypeptidase regulatory-like domain-containing protein n=1 Tax=Flavobacterium zepuense TaxID=2593302 RepID=A0A552V7F8_9FLAO|nr:TonB-dependent receptor [Flavobacterium zepuense]TRW26395.1 carboxypeptidase regulatory-like domain-containing protein [Flavobacterium zepuense]